MNEVPQPSTSDSLADRVLSKKTDWLMLGMTRELAGVNFGENVRLAVLLHARSGIATSMLVAWDEMDERQDQNVYEIIPREV